MIKHLGAGVAALLLAACSAAGDLAGASPPERPLFALSWTGTARVFPGGEPLELGVASRVVPFTSARTDTWLLAQGPSTTRSLVIEPRGGWIEREGRREAMPELMLRQERQQFALYGQMQRALAGAVAERLRGATLTVPGDGERSVDTTFLFDREGRMVEARNVVADAEKPGVLVPQVFRFSGEIVSNGLQWPRRIEIVQQGAVFFVLDIATFEAR